VATRVQHLLEAQGGWPRLAVVLCVGIAAVAALAPCPAALSELGEVAHDNAAQSYTDREIAGGNAVVPNQALMYQARARIPEDETYEVLVGEPHEGWPSFTVDHAAGYSRYFLMPRRPASGAPWVLCFNCGLEAAPAEVVWSNAEEGVSLVRRPG
jgi:hypothetical protein